MGTWFELHIPHPKTSKTWFDVQHWVITARWQLPLGKLTIKKKKKLWKITISNGKVNYKWQLSSSQSVSHYQRVYTVYVYIYIYIVYQYFSRQPGFIAFFEAHSTSSDSATQRPSETGSIRSEAPRRPAHFFPHGDLVAAAHHLQLQFSGGLRQIKGFYMIL